jgi:hypothetical protein
MEVIMVILVLAVIFCLIAAASTFFILKLVRSVRDAANHEDIGDEHPIFP